jgi:hypothetical protein
VETAAERGWSLLGNGELLAAAEEAGFDLMITTDQNLRYQQNLAARRIGIVVLMTTSWPRIRRQMDEVIAAVDGLPPGGFIEVRIV